MQFEMNPENLLPAGTFSKIMRDKFKSHEERMRE